MTCIHGNTHDVHCPVCDAPGKPLEKTRAHGQIANDLYSYATVLDGMVAPLIVSTMREAAHALEGKQGQPAATCVVVQRQDGHTVLYAQHGQVTQIPICDTLEQAKLHVGGFGLGHGRIVCQCAAVVYACRCSQSCHVKAMVRRCPKCQVTK